MRWIKPQVPSENSFFAALLHAIKHPADPSEKKTALRGSLVHRLRQIAEKLGDDRVVLQEQHGIGNGVGLAGRHQGLMKTNPVRIANGVVEIEGDGGGGHSEVVSGR